jgi:hypothetical protein
MISALPLRLVIPGEGQDDTRARTAIPDEPTLRKIVDQFAGPRTRLLVTGSVIPAEVVATSRHHPRPWSWEICRDGEPLPARLREDGFKTEHTATAAGRVVLRDFLAGLAEPAFRSATDRVPPRRPPRPLPLQIDRIGRRLAQPQGLRGSAQGEPDRDLLPRRRRDFEPPTKALQSAPKRDDIDAALMTRSQIAEAQRFARQWNPK